MNAKLRKTPSCPRTSSKRQLSQIHAAIDYVQRAFSHCVQFSYQHAELQRRRCLLPARQERTSCSRRRRSRRPASRSHHRLHCQRQTRPLQRFDHPWGWEWRVHSLRTVGRYRGAATGRHARCHATRQSLNAMQTEDSHSDTRTNAATSSSTVKVAQGIVRLKGVSQDSRTRTRQQRRGSLDSFDPAACARRHRSEQHSLPVVFSW